MRILLAEDNAIARKALAAGLSAEGYHVDMAEDGEQALRRARQQQPDFIISDILMPNMDGFSLCQAVRGDKTLQDIPVVFYSATFLDPEDEALARSVGASGFIHKDVDYEVFQRQLRDVIESSSTASWSVNEVPLQDRWELERQHNSALIRKLHKKVEELESEKRALRQSQQLLHHVVTTIPDVVFILSLPGLDATYVAPDAERLTGYSASDALGGKERWLELIYKEDQSEVLKQLSSAIENRDATVILSRMRHKTGGFRWIEARVTPRLDEQGEPLELIGSLTDVTKRVEAENQLRESERSLNTLFSNLPGVAYRCDNTHDWNMDFLSDGVERLTGYRREEVEKSRSISFADIIHPDDQGMVWEVVQEALQENRQFSVSYRICHRDGSVRWVWERGVGIEDAKHNRTTIEGFITDITLRKRAEEKLISSERRFRNLFQMLDSAMAVHELVYDDQGVPVDYRFTTVNPAFERVTGLSQEQVIGHTARELFPQMDEQWIEENIRVAITGEPARFVRYTPWLGRYFDVLVYRAEEHQFTSLFSDVTEQKRAEERAEYLARFPEENPSPVLRINGEGQIIYANPSSRALLDFYDGNQASAAAPDLVKEALKVLEERRPHSIDYATADRHYSFVMSPIPEADYVNLYGQDITRIVQASQQLERLNRVLRTLSKGNRTLIHAMSEEQLLERVCEVLASEGGYPFVWAAYLSANTLVRKASCGRDEDVMQPWLEELEVLDLDGHILAEALHSAEPYLLNDLQQPAWSRAQQSVLDKAKFDALLLLPLSYRGKEFGLLGLFAESSEVFDSDERELLSEMASDVAYGIQALRTHEANERSMERVQSTMLQTIEAISITLEKRDPYTAGHQQRVVQLAVAIAEEMQLPTARIEGLRLAALVHDIGKINVPAEILNRPGRLSDIEFGIIKSHPQVGYDILKGVEFDWPIAEMVLQHHERCDGSGYPQGLSGDQIVLEARILGVADVVEAINSHRPYRPGLGIDVAFKEIEEGRGSRYDPSVVDSCLRLFREKSFSWEYGDSSVFSSQQADTVRSDAH